MFNQCACGFQCTFTEDFHKHLKEKHNYSGDKICRIERQQITHPSQSIECGICQKICPSPKHFFMHLIEKHESDPMSAFDDVALAIQDLL